MGLEYASGLPTVPDYRALAGDPVFVEMERYSNRFVSQNEPALERYRQRWVADPLHQWSRQWEYPFVYSRLLEHIRSRGQDAPMRILDAGSGVTFFPYYVSTLTPGAEVTCVDCDPGWAEPYSSLNARVEKPVEFVVEDLEALSFPEGAFDMVYCISVLEHTDDPRTVLSRMRRVIKPGGILVVTFDICLNGNADIPIERAEPLIDALYHCFPDSEAIDYRELERKARAPGTLTTKYVGRENPKLLPWQLPTSYGLRRWLNFGRGSDAYPNLTVFCHVFRR